VSDTNPVQSLRPHIPNALTVLRFVLAGVFVAVLSVAPADETGLRRACLWAAALFIVAAATDALDGHLARRWNVISTFGRVMDPVADKVLVLGAFILLAGPAFVSGAGPGPPDQRSGVEPWMVVLMLLRELGVTSIRAVLESAGVKFPADTAGKLKMILQSTTAPLILILIGLGRDEPGAWGRWAIVTAVWTTVAMTLLSALPYLARAARVGGLQPDPARATPDRPPEKRA
jgi:CDP-diacylglycerol--glycerol-3-phosphate 3-phosphatidyltransferase